MVADWAGEQQILKYPFGSDEEMTVSKKAKRCYHQDLSVLPHISNLLL